MKKENNLNSNKAIKHKTALNKISVVIPIFNEVDNIFNLLEEIFQVLNEKYIFEIILINDCSTDNFLKEFKKNIFFNKIILFNNKSNLGQSKSLLLGIENAQYNNIVTLDGDGQNDPIDFLKLSDYYFKKKYEFVSGIRKHRKDDFIKKTSSIIANKFRSLLLRDNCPDTGCGLKVFNKNFFLKIPFFDGMHRFLPALFIGMNLKVVYVEVNHRSRKFGYSKYGTLKRLFKGIFDIFRVLKIIRDFKKNHV